MPIHRIRLTFQLSALSALLLAGPASSVTDISNRPLITNQVSVKPNLMFILDNSGSMAWEFIPNAISSANAVGFYSPQCNGAAYNPSTTYPLPVTPDGREYPSASLSAAWEDGFNPEFATSLYPVSTAVNSVVPLQAHKSAWWLTTGLQGGLRRQRHSRPMIVSHYDAPVIQANGSAPPWHPSRGQEPRERLFSTLFFHRYTRAVTRTGKSVALL